MLTVGSILLESARRLRVAGIEDPRIEAEVLLGHALGLARGKLYARLGEPLPEADCFETLLVRRLAHEPTAYITGHREFYGLDLLCTPAALVPRPETELLVEIAGEWLRSEGRQKARRQPLVADIGTGNGAVAVAIAANGPGARVVGVDSSQRALELARRNAERHGVTERVDFVQGSLLGAVRGTFDVIVANLPYVSDAEYEVLASEIREFEPADALRAGPRGTEVIEELLEQARERLAAGGLLLAEHAWDQGERLRDVARQWFHDGGIETRRDLAGHDRVLVVASKG